MATAQTRRPCRKCGGPKVDKSRHSWYCAGCADRLWSDRNKARNLCGEDHCWTQQCLECYRLKKIRDMEGGRKSAETRRKNRPHFYRPKDAGFKAWQGRAHAAVQHAIKIGLLPSLKTGEYACVDCGGVALEYDHRDYGRPVEVEPVCRSCNKRRGRAKWPQPREFKRIKHLEAA